MSCSRSGHLKSPYTHRCVTCKAFKDDELKSFARLLGQSTKGTRKELCNRVRGLVNPARFDELTASLDGKRRRSLKARRRSLERLALNGDGIRVEAARTKMASEKAPTLFDFIDNGFATPSASRERQFEPSPVFIGTAGAPTFAAPEIDMEDVELEDIDERSRSKSLFDFVGREDVTRRKVKKTDKQILSALLSRYPTVRRNVDKELTKAGSTIVSTKDEILKHALKYVIDGHNTDESLRKAMWKAKLSSNAPVFTQQNVPEVLDTRGWGEGAFVPKTKGEYPGDDQAIRDFIRAYAAKKYASPQDRKSAMSRDLRTSSNVIPKSQYRKWKAEPWKYDLADIDDGLSEEEESMFHKRHFEAWGEEQ